MKHWQGEFRGSQYVMTAVCGTKVFLCGSTEAVLCQGLGGDTSAYDAAYAAAGIVLYGGEKEALERIRETGRDTTITRISVRRAIAGLEVVCQWVGNSPCFVKEGEGLWYQLGGSSGDDTGPYSSLPQKNWSGQAFRSRAPFADEVLLCTSSIRLCDLDDLPKEPNKTRVWAEEISERPRSGNVAFVRVVP